MLIKLVFVHIYNYKKEIYIYMHCIYVIYDVVGCIIRTGDLEFNIHFFSRFSFFIIPTRHILIRDTYTHTMCVITF